MASPNGGEERAAGRMGSASRRPLVARWTGTIFFYDVATLSFLLVRKSYCKIRPQLMLNMVKYSVLLIQTAHPIIL